MKVTWSRTSLLLLAFLSLSLLASTAWAEQSRSVTADEADVEFRLGNQAFMRGDCQTALSHYFASNRLVPNSNVIFNIAACYENLGRPVEAFRYYTAFLELSTDEEERENVEVALERTRQNLGLLQIETTPPGATIFIDRRDLGSYGTTPQILPLEPGTYRVILDHQAWESFEIAELVVEAGDNLRQHVTLTRREGQIDLAGQPSRITVTVEPFGEPQTIDLPASISAPVGQQSLLVEAPGFQPSRVPVEVLEGGEVSAEISLERETGSVVVTSTETNSAVLLDGVLVGFTPVVLGDVPTGERRIIVQQEGFAPHETLLEVERDARLEVNARLSAVTEVAAASRVAEDLRDAPASVSLISSREIEAFAYAGTADALQGVRGIFLTNDRTYNLLGVRGYGPFGQYGNRTLLQIDGHTLNDNWVEASYHQFELLNDLYGLERIEIIRGPNSVLYGSGAFQGVVNMVSSDINDPYRRSRVGATAVTDGVLRGYAHLRQPFENGGLQLSAGVTGGQPFNFFSPARVGSDEAPTGVAEGVGGFQAMTVRGNAQWHGLRFYGHFHDRELQIPTASFETLFADQRARANDQRGFLGVRFEDPRQDETVTFHGRAYYDYYGYNGDFPYDEEDGGLLSDRFRGHWGGVEARTDIRPTDTLRLSIGGELVRHFIHDAISSAEFDDDVVTSSNPFWKTSGHISLRQELGALFSLWAGARYDLWLFEGLDIDGEVGEARQISSVNPRAALLFRPLEESTFKLMGGRGFRAPSVYELTYNDGGITQIASPNLDPETIYSLEFEYTQGLPESFEIIGAVYGNRIGTRIEQTGEGFEEDPFQFANIDTDLWTAGAEIELRRPFLQGWMASIQYSYQRTGEGVISDLLGNPHAISNSPNHLAAFKLVNPLVRPSLQMANRLIFEGPRVDRVGELTSPVFLWDLVFSGQVPDLPFRYAAGVRNLLNWQYAHPVGEDILDIRLSQPGRTFVVDISATF